MLLLLRLFYFFCIWCLFANAYYFFYFLSYNKTVSQMKQLKTTTTCAYNCLNIMAHNLWVIHFIYIPIYSTLPRFICYIHNVHFFFLFFRVCILFYKFTRAKIQFLFSLLFFIFFIFKIL